jgi:ubiquinone/menaquinone biosynthesis C-methylase UbiE
MTSDKKLKTSFGAISNNYDKYRPDYSQKLINDVILYSKIKKSANILEIGSGSGLASQYFLKKGFNLTMLDVSKELTKIAKKKFKNYKNTKYIVDTFEKAKLPADNFDLIFSAQAFHWIDPKVGFKKVHKLLKQNSTFAIFWNLTDSNKSEITKQIKKLYKKYCPDYKGVPATKPIKNFKNNPTFKNVIIKSYPYTTSFEKSYYLKLIQTYSWVASLNPKQKEALLEKIKIELAKYKEPIHIPYKTLLCMGRKK